MFSINYQQLILLSLTVTFVSTRDLINFNVYQVGSRIFGDFKLPSAQIESDFHFEQTNATRCTFNFNSHAPYTFDLNGEGSISDNDNGIATISGQLVSSSAQTIVNFTSELSHGGRMTSAKIDFNITDMVSGTYLFEVNEVDKCVTYKMKQNLTTNPPGMINYRASLRNLCDYDGINRIGEQYEADLSSFKWPWINSTFNQYIGHNLTDGFEAFNFQFDKLGHIIGESNYSKDPVLKMKRRFTFFSKIQQIPSFRLDKEIDGGKVIMAFEPINPFTADIQSATVVRPLSPHANDPSVW